MALPANVQTSTVKGQYLMVDKDAPGGDLRPDGMPISGMLIRLIPSIKVARYTGAEPKTLVMEPIDAFTNSEGRIEHNGELGVQVIATDSAFITPTNFTYRVEMTPPGRERLTFDISAPAGQDIDLTMAIPVPASPGEEMAAWLAAIAQVQVAASQANLASVQAAAHANSAFGYIAESQSWATAAAASAASAANAASNAIDDVVYNVLEHGAVGDGVADDTDAVQAIINSAPRGATLWAPAGAVFRTRGWTSYAKPLKVRFGNAECIQIGAAPIFDVYGEWGAVHPVTAVSSTGVISTVNASEYAPGDIVKVFSHDIIADGRPSPTTVGGFSRHGEFAVVSSVTSTALTVSPRPRENYTTQIRVAKMYDHAVSIEVGKSSHVTGGSGVQFRLSSLPWPYLNVNITRGNGAAAQTRSTFGAQTFIRANNLPAGTGYGLSSANCVAGNHTIFASRIRHAYTDDMYQNITDEGEPDPRAYGRTMFERITGVAVNAAESAWDTHHGGYGHKFISAIAYGASGQAGFSVRGRAHEWINCTAFDCATGFRIYTEAAEPWSTSTNHVALNCRALNCGTPVVASLKSWTEVTGGPTLTINGGLFESRGGNLMNVANARVQLVSKPVFRYRANAAPSNGFLFQLGPGELTGEVQVEVEEFDTGVISAMLYCSNVTDGRTQMVDLDMDVKVNDYLRTRVSEVVWANTVSGQVRVRFNGPTTIPAAGHNSLPAGVFSIIKSTIGSSAVGSSTAATAISVGANMVLPMRSIGDPEVTMFCTVTTHRTVLGIAQGALYGQRLNVHNARDSTALLRVPTTGSNIGTLADVEISPGSSAKFFWNGTLWEKG